uniref:chitinase n=2 Tax=Lygus hesperus TaxID=30085 RepID=A0A0A9X4Q1_LYGHE|nr:putative chitinase 5 [Lygus hesperus]
MMTLWLLLLAVAAVTAESWIPISQLVNSTANRGQSPYFQRQWGEMVLEAERLDSRLSSLLKASRSRQTGVGDKRYKVVCYFTNWAWYRKGKGKFVPEDIDTNLCTHVVYAFAVLDAEKMEIKVFDSWADIDNKFYKRIASLAQKGVKASMGIGGWTDSAGDKYSKMVNNPSSRSHFVQQVTGFIEKYGFTGLDLDWEYPKCWQNECSRGPASDKHGFSILLAELSAVFKPRKWHLSAAVSPNSAVIDVAYDVPSLSQHLDWVGLMSYDYHGPWDRKTGHVAPLHHHNGDSNPHFNVEYSINYWLGKGLRKDKLVVGMPMYGKSFTLANPSNNGLNAPTNGPGRGGPVTNAGGTLAFYEICAAVKREHWKTRRESDGSMGPYAFKGDQWVSYDDISDIKKKSELIKAKGLGGGMIWTPDFDDFKNTCGCGRYPLLTALSSTLNGGPAPHVQNCAS